MTEELVHSSVEETLNNLLEKAAQELTTKIFSIIQESQQTHNGLLAFLALSSILNAYFF